MKSNEAALLASFDKFKAALIETGSNTDGLTIETMRNADPFGPRGTFYRVKDGNTYPYGEDGKRAGDLAGLLDFAVVALGQVGPPR